MSTVIVDTGGRSSYSATLTDAFPFTATGEGQYPVWAISPMVKRYEISFGSAPTEVKVILFVTATAERESEDEKEYLVYVKWAASITVAGSTFTVGTVECDYAADDWADNYTGTPYITVPAGSTAFQAPFEGVPFDTMTVEVGVPLRKMATIKNETRYPHYVSETPTRWGKQVGELDEVVDLREWSNAEVSWWIWPEDGGINIRITGGGQTLVSWTQAVASLPSVLASPTTYAFSMWGWRYAEVDTIGERSGSLTVAFPGGGPNWDTVTHTLTEPNIEGYGGEFIAVESGNTVTLTARTQPRDPPLAGDPTFDDGICSWVGISGQAEPAFDVTFNGELVSVHDEPYPDATYTAGPYDAVKPDSDPEVVRYPIAKVFPKAGLPGSTGLNIPMPGSTRLHGKVYTTSNYVFNHFGTPDRIGGQTRNDKPDGGLAFEWALPVTGNEWRLVQQVPGLNWTALTLTQEASHVIETFASAVNGWAAAGAETVSISGGALKIEGANPKTVTKTYDDIGTDVWWDHLRYFVVDCTAAAADVVLTVTIGSKTWTVTGDANGDFLIDLCAPSNASGVDYSSTRYEREYASGAESLSEGGWGWGLNGLLEQTVQLSFATADDVLINEIRAVAAGQQGEARHSVQFGETVSIDERLRIEDTTDDPPHQVWAQLGLTHWLSGKVVGQEAAGTLEEEPDAVAPAPPQSATPWTINQMYNAFAVRYGDEKGLPRIANTGYKASRTPTTLTVGEQSFTYYPKAEWCNNTQYAYHLVPNFKEGTGPLALLAHYAVDRISFGPGAASQIKVRKIYQGGVNGIVESNDVPAAQAALNVKVGATKIDGTGTGNTGVYWLPATPEWDDWHTEAFDIMPNGEDPPTATHTGLIHAMFLRACLTAEVSAQGGGLTMVKTSAGRIYRAYTSGTKIKFDVYTVGARTWSTAIDLCDGAQPSLLMYDSVPGAKRTRELYCYYVRDGQIRRRKSVSEGQTWGAEDSSGIMATKPFLQYDPDTSTTYFLYYDGGTIKFQLSYDHGTTWSVPANVVSASDDFMSLQLAYEPDSSGKRKRALILSYITGAGAVAVKKSFDDGHTWE